MAIQIVRFKDGLDVISNVYDCNQEIELADPMIFQIRNSHLVLQHWLPLAVMKGDSVNVNKDDILCRMDPNDDFKEYYETTVDNLKKEITDIRNKKEPEEGLDVMEAIAELTMNKDNINIH